MEKDTEAETESYFSLRWSALDAMSLFQLMETIRALCGTETPAETMEVVREAMPHMMGACRGRK